MPSSRALASILTPIDESVKENPEAFEALLSEIVYLASVADAYVADAYVTEGSCVPWRTEQEVLLLASPAYEPAETATPSSFPFTFLRTCGIRLCGSPPCG